MEERVAELNSVYKSLAAQRAPWETWWDRLRDYVLPRRLNREGEVSLPNRDAMDRMTDTTAVEACQKLASGHMSYITPSHDVWFKWSAPDDRGGDEAEAWYNQCSEIALKELSVSNFYTEIHECFLDRVALGTGSLFTGTSSDGRLLFTNIPCGQFACAENAEGRVDTYVREFTYTAHQARSMFGVKALGPKAREVLERGGNPYATTLRFLHVVRPRTRRSRRREQASHMPFESVYLSLDDQVIVEEGGYMEFPYLVTRFLKWGSGPYGLAPGRLVFPAIQQVQFLILLARWPPFPVFWSSPTRLGRWICGPAAGPSLPRRPLPFTFPGNGLRRAGMMLGWTVWHRSRMRYAVPIICLCWSFGAGTAAI